MSLVMKYLWKYQDKNLKFLIIDLDAHQGNGYETDMFCLDLLRENVYILDIYNPDIFPKDKFAQIFINRKVEIQSQDANDDHYLNIMKSEIISALDEF